MNAERLVRLATLAVSRSPDLLRCTPQSVLVAFMDASRLGLEVGGPLGEAYLIPFKNKNGTSEAQFVVGYQGLLKLVYQTGMIKGIVFGVVRQGDLFVPPRKMADHNGLVTRFEHEERAPTSEPRTHVYAVAQLMNGGIASVCLTAQQMAEHIARIPAAKFDRSVWQSRVSADVDAMWIKTALRRLCKYLPKSTELAEALDHAAKDEYEDDRPVIFDATQFTQEPTVKKTRSKLISEQLGVPPDVMDTTEPAKAATEQAQPAPSPEKADAQAPPPQGFEEFRLVCWEAAEQLGSTEEEFNSAMEKCVRLGGFKGKEDKVTAEWKAKVIDTLTRRVMQWEYLARK